MHDIAFLEEQGIPGAFVASEEFRSAADAQSRSLGVDSAALYVRHPIQDRTDAEMVEIADATVALAMTAIAGQR